MSFDLSTLADYTKQNVDLLISASVFTAKTAQLIMAQGVVMANVKSSETINRLETDAVFQTDSGCGFTPSGTTAITQRMMTVGKIKVNEAFCPKDLEAKYTQQALSVGGSYESMPFEEYISEQKIEKIAEGNEVAIWQGDTGSGNGQLNKFDGFIKFIDQASGSVIHANQSQYISGGPISSGTVLAGDTLLNVVDGMWVAIPARVKGKSDMRVFCGWDIFDQFILALKNKNLYHYAPEHEEGEIKIPGTQYILTAVHGLDGTNRLFSIRLSNMYLGTDMEGEDKQFDMFWANEAEEVRFRARWKLGTQIGIPTEIVEFHR